MGCNGKGGVGRRLSLRGAAASASSSSSESPSSSETSGSLSSYSSSLLDGYESVVCLSSSMVMDMVAYGYYARLIARMRRL